MLALGRSGGKIVAWELNLRVFQNQIMQVFLVKDSKFEAYYMRSIYKDIIITFNPIGLHLLQNSMLSL